MFPSSENLSRTISTSVRPARVAILINKSDADWMQTCLRIIEWTTSVWGGWYSCLIPTDGETIEDCFWHLLEEFDPDYIYAYQKTGRDFRIVDPERFNEQVEADARAFVEKYLNSNIDESRASIAEQYDHAEAGHFEVYTELCQTLVSRLTPFHYRESPFIDRIIARQEEIRYPLTDLVNLLPHLAQPIGATISEFNGSTLAQLMVYSMAGKIWPGLETKLQPGISQFQHETLSTEDMLRRLHPLWGTAEYAQALPLANCSYYYPIGKVPNGDAPTVVIGDTLEDYCLYYALSKMRGRTYWLPRRVIEAFHAQEEAVNLTDTSLLLGEEKIYPKFLSYLRERHRNKSVFFLSRSMDDDEIKAFAENMANEAGNQYGEEAGFRFEVSPDWEAVLPYVRRLYEQDNIYTRYRDQFDDGTSINFIGTPKPKHLTKIPPVDFYWITEVSIENYQLPRVAEFGPETIVHHNYGTDEVRVSREGFAYFCPYIGYFGGDIDAVLVKPRIQLSEPISIYETFFNGIGQHIQFSDKGNYHLGCVEKFGKLADYAAFFRTDTNRRILDLYLKNGKNDRSEAGKGDKIADRRYLDFRALNQIVGDAAEEATAALLDEWLSCAVLHRGFTFLCAHCRQAGWYSIEEVGNSFRCSRCRKIQVYTRKNWKKPFEPAWSYQLDEIVYQAYCNDGHVPTLALDVLRRRAKSSFFYVPECEILKDRNASKQEMELDFSCCVDGDIYIGEAKITNKIEQADGAEKASLMKYSEMAERINAKKVVLCTFADAWDERTTGNARNIIGQKRLVLLQKSELLAEPK